MHWPKFMRLTFCNVWELRTGSTQLHADDQCAPQPQTGQVAQSWLDHTFINQRMEWWRGSPCISVLIIAMETWRSRLLLLVCVCDWCSVKGKFQNEETSEMPTHHHIQCWRQTWWWTRALHTCPKQKKKRCRETLTRFNYFELWIQHG